MLSKESLDFIEFPLQRFIVVWRSVGSIRDTYLDMSLSQKWGPPFLPFCFIIVVGHMNKALMQQCFAQYVVYLVDINIRFLSVRAPFQFIYFLLNVIKDSNKFMWNATILELEMNLCVFLKLYMWNNYKPIKIIFDELFTLVLVY